MMVLRGIKKDEMQHLDTGNVSDTECCKYGNYRGWKTVQNASLSNKAFCADSSVSLDILLIELDRKHI